MTAYSEAVTRLDQTPPNPFYNLNAYSLGTNPGGLGGYGHRIAFFGALADVLTVSGEAVAKTAIAVTSAATAVGAAAAAVNAPGTICNSVTPRLIGTGAKAFVIETGKSVAIGAQMIAASKADPAKRMVGSVTAYNTLTGDLSLNVTETAGAGTPADWTFSLTAMGVSSTRQILVGGLASGGGDLSADRTITVTAAAAAAVRTGSTTSQVMTPGDTYSALAVVALTDAATIAVNMASFINAKVTLGGNRVLGNPTNTKVGQMGTIEIAQDGTGSRTMAFGSNWKRQGGAPSMSTAAGARDFVKYEVIDATTILYSFIRSPS
jgi:hypothetical protein